VIPIQSFAIVFSKARTDFKCLLFEFRLLADHRSSPFIPGLYQLPPPLYAATIYMIYERIATFVNAPDASVIGPGRVTKIFVTGDVISFLIQAAGEVIIAQAGHQDFGQRVVPTDLFCRLLFFGFFLIIAIIFNRRMGKDSMRYSIPKYGKHSCRALLRLLFVAAVITIARYCYWIVNFAGGAGL
jgi:hypothetical protein